MSTAKHSSQALGQAGPEASFHDVAPPAEGRTMGDILDVQAPLMAPLPGSGLPKLLMPT